MAQPPATVALADLVAAVRQQRLQEFPQAPNRLEPLHAFTLSHRLKTVVTERGSELREPRDFGELLGKLNGAVGQSLDQHAEIVRLGIIDAARS